MKSFKSSAVAVRKKIMKRKGSMMTANGQVAVVRQVF